MPATIRRLLLLPIVTALLAAGCGGSDSDDAGQAPSAIEASLAEYFGDPANDTPVTNQADADCVAREITALFGDDTLRELGVTETFVPELEDMGMSDEQVGWVLTGFNNCVDLIAAFEASMAEDVGADGAACMVDALGETVINEMLRASMANDAAQMDATSEAFVVAASFCGLA